MPEIKQDFEIWAGEDADIRIKGIRGLESFESIISITWKVSETSDSIEPLIQKSITHTGDSWISDGIYIDEVIDDLIIIELDRADTLAMGGSRYYHELLVVDGAGGTNVATIGRMKVNSSNFADVGE